MSDDLDVPVLILVGGALDGTKFSVDDAEPKTLGAHAECDFPIRLENVAERHARLVWAAGILAIADLSSQTGVYVNGEKVEGERSLEQGDRVCLGPPGSKQSAKLLVKLPEIGIGTQDDSAEDVFTLEGEGEDDAAVGLVPVDLSLEGEAPEIHPDFSEPPAPPPPPSRPAPPPPPPPPAPESEELALEEGEVLDLNHSTEPPPAVEPLIPVAPEIDEPAPSRPPPAAARPTAPERPDYQTAPPSIAPMPETRTGDAPPAAAAPRARAAAPRPISPRPLARPRGGGRGMGLPPIPPAAMWGGAATILVIGGYWAISTFLGPSPVVEGILPPKLEVGQTVTVSGEHFADDVAGNTVKIGDQTATVVRASEMQVVATVPELGAGTWPLVIESRGRTSNAMNVTIAPIPRIKSIRPDVALPGQEVTLHGANLGAGKPSVTVGGAGAKVVEVKGDMVRVRVPSVEAAEGQTVPVVVKIGTEASRPVSLLLGRLPLLESVAPRQALAGERVTLKGRGFAPIPGGNVVHFGSVRALTVKASTTELTVLVPSPYGMVSQVRVGIRLSVGGSQSAEQAFTILQESSGMYLPRFHAAAPPEIHDEHAHAVVATPLGPVLLLTGRASAPSVAERAEAVAQALNQVFGSVQSGGGSLEYRNAPPSVALSGSRDPIVTVTSEDAAGMSESWRGSRGTPVNAQSLGRYWTALLSDYLSLFAARQRPVSTVQLSPQGKTFLDIYAQAVRRTGTPAGVPVSLISPLPAPWAESIERMALTPPGAGTAARADTAVEGAWAGTMKDADGERRLQVEITRQGATLGGTVTTQKGAIAMKAPLTNVSFQGGVLRFDLAHGASKRRCEGALQGDTITGTVKNEGGQTVGEFTLRFSS